jgi:hypothetical protein
MGDGKLFSGSFTTVLWPLEHSYPTLFVPVSAVTTDQQHTFVVRITNDIPAIKCKLRQKPIKNNGPSDASF